MATLAALYELSQHLLDNRRSIDTLVKQAGQLRELVERVSGLHMQTGYDINAGKTITANGLAVSTAQAAHCAREPLRTAAFIKGLHLAIQTILKNRTQARVLYAGCGPYALLALPAMACYPSAQLEFSLLEIHQQTLEHAHQLIHDLGLEAHISDSHCVDASRYRIPVTASPDIIVSETMNIALGKEPQVAIMRNLSMQAPQALLVPQEVHVHLGEKLTFVAPDVAATYRDLGCVFTLDAKSIQDWQGARGDLPAYGVSLNNTDARALYLLTRIRTFGIWQLHDHQSSLNLPQKLMLTAEQAAQSRLAFGYRLGPHPGLFLT